MPLKQKSPSLPRNLALSTFSKLLIGKRYICYISAIYEAKLFAKNFSKNSDHDGSGISLPVFHSRTNLKLHNISITPRMFSHNEP